MKKNAFSMIELVFVIVILGILAAIAVPRLTASRSDAELVVTTKNLTQIIKDVQSMMTSKGDWPSSWSEITNVPIYDVFGNSAQVANPRNSISSFYLHTGKEPCLRVATRQGTNTTAKQDFMIIVNQQHSSSKCNKVLANARENNILDSYNMMIYKYQSTGINP